MATLYGDLIGGDNANDGTSFANRWKDFVNGATAARTAPSDVCRWMGQSPVSLGINATFTKKSPTVTLASALTTLIDNCESAWTAEANVTTSTTTVRKQGSNANQFAIASGFTTGRVCRKDLGSDQDYSGHDAITCWIRFNASVASGVFRIDLEDSGGTPVDSLTINLAIAANIFTPLFLKKGSALGNAIRYVSVYAISDPGTVTGIIDNVNAADGNSLGLTGLIGISSSATNIIRYPIRYIDGTTVYIDQGINSLNTATPKGYAGATTTTTIYYLEPAPVFAGQITNDGGTSDSALITHEGGYDTTNMTTQDSYTWVALYGTLTNVMSQTQSFVKFKRFVFVGGSGGITTGTSYGRFEDIGAINNSGTCINLSQGYIIAKNLTALCGSGAGINIAGSGAHISGTNYSHSHSSQGFQMQTRGCRAPAIFECANNNFGFYCLGVVHGVQKIIANDNGSSGVQIGSNGGSPGIAFIGRIEASGNGSYGVDGSLGYAEIHSVETSLNGSIGIYSQGGSYLRIGKTSCGEATKISTSTLSGNAEPISRVDVSAYEGDALDSRIYQNATVVAKTQTTTRRTAADVAWQQDPQSYHTADFPFDIEMETVVCDATSTTIKVYCYRSSTNITAQLVIPAYQLGLSADVVVSSTTTGSWELLEATFTPSIAGAITPILRAYQGAGAGTAYWDDGDAV